MDGFDRRRLDLELEDMAKAKPRTWGRNIGDALMMAARTQVDLERRRG
jgi:hypothetical protein